MLPFLLAGFITFCGGILSGMAGFGALLLVVPALIIILGMHIAIPLSVLCGITTQGVNAATFRAYVPWRPLGLMLLGSLPGIWLGSSLLQHVPEVAMRAALGCLLIVYVIWSVRSKAAPSRSPAPAWACVAGFISGSIGGAFGINGPPAVVYATRTTWPPQAMRALLGWFCGLLFVTTAVVMFFRGMYSLAVLQYAAVTIPACLLGSRCGHMIAARLRPAHYMRMVFALLFIMGLSLCWPLARTLL